MNVYPQDLDVVGSRWPNVAPRTEAMFFPAVFMIDSGDSSICTYCLHRVKVKVPDTPNC